MSVAIVDTIDLFGTTAGSSLLSGLQAYWKLDEAAAGSVVDAVGMYPGTAYNISYNISGKISRCYNFNGTSSYVSFGDVIKPTAGLTISLWMKSSSITGTPSLLCHTEYDGNWKGYRMDIDSSGVFYMVLGDGNDAHLLGKASSGGGVLLNGSWHHLVVTWDGSLAYMYYDNNKSTGDSWPYTISYVVGQYCYLGQGNSSNFYSGDIDEVCIWNRGVTDAEVSTLFSATPYPFS
jgi:hypothetical protein